MDNIPAGKSPSIVSQPGSLPASAPTAKPKQTSFSSHDTKRRYIPPKTESGVSGKHIHQRRIRSEPSLLRSEDVASLRQELEKLHVDQESVRKNQQFIQQNVNTAQRQLRRDQQRLDKQPHLNSNDTVSSHQSNRPQRKKPALQSKTTNEGVAYEQYQDQLNATKTAYQDSLLQLKVLKQSIVKHKNTIEELRDQLHHFKDHSSHSPDNTQALNEVEEQLQQAETENVELRNGNRGLEVICAGQQEKIASQEQEVSALKESLDISTKKSEDLEKQLNAFNGVAQKRDELQQIYEALTQELEQQTQASEMLKTEILQKQEQLNELHYQHTRDEETIETLAKRADEAGKALTAKQQETKELQQQNQQMRARIEQFDNLPKTEKEELRKLKKELSEAKANRDTATNRYNILLATNQKLINTLGQQDKLITELNKKIKKQH